MILAGAKRGRNYHNGSGNDNVFVSDDDASELSCGSKGNKKGAPDRVRQGHLKVLGKGDIG